MIGNEAYQYIISIQSVAGAVWLPVAHPMRGDAVTEWSELSSLALKVTGSSQLVCGIFQNLSCFYPTGNG